MEIIMQEKYGECSGVEESLIGKTICTAVIDEKDFFGIIAEISNVLSQHNDLQLIWSDNLDHY